MVISLVYTPSFLAVECARENSNGRIVRHRLVQLAMKLVVVQFCREKDHESMKAQSVCAVRKLRDAVFAPPPASYEPAAA